jgi:hypothetical protein
MTTTITEDPWVYCGAQARMLEVLEVAVFQQHHAQPVAWEDLSPLDQLKYHGEACQYMASLIGRGAVRSEADVRAEVKAELVASLRAEAAAMKTRDGRFEMQTFADLLEARP